MHAASEGELMEDVTTRPSETQPAVVDRTEQRAETVRLLRRLYALPDADPSRARLRDRVIAEHMNYARHLARRYAGPGGSLREDLDQVAYLGLVKAVDKFDPERGTPFLGYATPMIIGEIKRHYRDATWAVHVPRRMQELTRDLHQASETLTAELGHAPTIGRLAERLGVSREEIRGARNLGRLPHHLSRPNRRR
jgi:RNA polymerase sigma-B factor